MEYKSGRNILIFLCIHSLFISYNQLRCTVNKENHRRRIVQVFIITCLLFLAITGKLTYEQIFHHDIIMTKAKNLWQRDFKISGQRGTIYSSDGEALAYDLPTSSVVVVPSQIEDQQKTALFLSEVLNCDYNMLLDKISKRVSTQKLQPEGRNITDEQAFKIMDAHIKGVILVQDSKRFYPHQHYLSQVLGFSGIDNQGLAGIELQYDEYLTSKPGSLKIGFDAKGNPLNMDQQLVYPGIGMDLVLTIDSTIQSILEREINHMVMKYEPDQAIGIAMDPHTGAILAMVSKPDFDPNHYQEYSQEIINRNLPIWMSFEPGSTFKAVTFASALEEELFDMYTDTYYDKGYEMVAGARIKSWRAGGHGLQTFLQVLENSSNPGFVEIGRRLGLDRLYQYVTDFGFGKKTGIDLPGESSGIMFKKEVMGEVEQATVSFGQGLSVTPLQLVRAFSAIINGGHLYQPYILKQIIHPLTDEIIQETTPIHQGQIISDKTSQLMQIALESVVANGGGKNAYIDGYKIGGKTGTAQKAENGIYLSNEYILSFLSAAPIDDPQIVLFVAADSPKNDVQYGGTVVAPVVKAAYEDILNYLNVEKVDVQIPKKTTWLDPKVIEVPDLIGKTRKECKIEGLEIEFNGDGDRVVDQYPQAKTKLNENGKVLVILD